MAEQLAFDLPIDTALGRDNFFASDANSHAVGAIESWPDWPSRTLVLVGPEGAGKSHLAQIWADMTKALVVEAAADWHAWDIEGAVCVENVHTIAGNRKNEEKLFHLFNIQSQKGSALLMTGVGVPSIWDIHLADLASRLHGSQLVKLCAPDDTLLAAVLLKQCADRQLQLEPGVVDYILRRSERSFAGMRNLVAALDRLSLQRKRPVGQRLVRETLAQMGTGE